MSLVPSDAFSEISLSFAMVLISLTHFFKYVVLNGQSVFLNTPSGPCCHV